MFIKIERCSLVWALFIGVPNQYGVPCKYFVTDDFGNMVIVPVKSAGFSLT